MTRPAVLPVRPRTGTRLRGGASSRFAAVLEEGLLPLLDAHPNLCGTPCELARAVRRALPRGLKGYVRRNGADFLLDLIEHAPLLRSAGVRWALEPGRPAPVLHLWRVGQDPPHLSGRVRPAAVLRLLRGTARHGRGPQARALRLHR